MTGKGSGASRAPRGARARNDADHALADANAELEDTAAALDSADAVREPIRPIPTLPDGLLQRRLANETRDKEKANAEKEKANSEKEKALQEKELIQKRLNEMEAELQLARANVGAVTAVVEVTPARKVYLDSLDHVEGVFYLLEQGILVRADESFPQRQKAVASVREFTATAFCRQQEV